MSATYNEYILSTAVEHGWITPEQRATVETHLATLPGAAALDYLNEQQFLTPEVAQWFQQTLMHHEAQAVAAQESSAPVQEASSSEAASASVTVISGSGALESVADYLRLGMELDASDVHLGVGTPPVMRRYGELVPMFDGASPLTAQETERLALSFLNDEQKRHIEERGDSDFCYSIEGLGRFRSSVVRQRRGLDMVFRLIQNQVRTMDELGLPPELKRLTQYQNGLVLVTGPMGCGKSTTLAAMVQEVNLTRHDHIITLEDPIEYTMLSQGCHVTQREIPHHSKSFASALRAALREDPDVIMVGEMRDLETIQLAITASETGHLVFSTLHTNNAARTLDRVLDVFPADQREQIRVMVSESLRGIVSQTLVPRADGRGRALALEVLVNTPATASLIRDGKTFMIPGVMQTGKKLGMRIMDDSLMELLQAAVITPQEAWERAEQKKLFEPYLR
jgi:twitching motility protein PilT